MPEPKPYDWEAAARALAEERDALLAEVARLKTPAGPPPRWFQNPKVAGVISEVSAALTLLASFSYTLGPAADLLPPEAKKWISSVGVFATLALQGWKRYLEPKPVANAPVPPAALR